MVLMVLVADGLEKPLQAGSSATINDVMLACLFVFQVFSIGRPEGGELLCVGRGCARLVTQMLLTFAQGNSWNARYEYL